MPRIMCKRCRRIGEKLCSRGKCALVRKPYPPGGRGRKRRRSPSEYGVELMEKQKIATLYGLGDRQLRRYVNTAVGQRRDTTAALISALERRFDTAVFRLGFAPSSAGARQLTSHGHFLVNGARITIPSYPLRPGDVIAMRTVSRAKGAFHELGERLKKHTPPAWLELDRENLTGKVLRVPGLEDLSVPPANLRAVVEYYSR